MSRYAAMFDRCSSNGEGAFGAFLMLGDASAAYLDALVEGGADMVEVGIPFSDPVADGPVIQAAAVRALQAGVRTVDCLTMIAHFRARHPDIPVGILTYAKNMPGDTLIVATEPHIIHQMEKAVPEKKFVGAPGADGNCNCNICPYMALNTLEKLYISLRDLQPRIEMDETLRLGARKSLDRMLEMASGSVGKGDVGARP